MFPKITVKGLIAGIITTAIALYVINKIPQIRRIVNPPQA
jgi:hypothetical protein